MLGFLSAIGSALGIVRPGALIQEEELILVEDLLAKLRSMPNWAQTVAAKIAPSNQIAVTSDLLYFQQKVQRDKADVPITVLRFYSDMLEKIVAILGTSVSVPQIIEQAVTQTTPTPVVAPVTTVAAPDLVCPYDKPAATAPTNWNDPAAETRYLNKYTDVKMAVEKGVQPSGLWHYRCHGKKEGRTWEGWGGWNKKPGFLGDYKGRSFKGYQRPGFLR